jgi:tight adherence protein B
VLFGGAIALFAGLVILIVLAQTSERRVHLLGRADRKAAKGGRSAMTDVADRAVIFAESALQGRERQRRLAGTLEQAGIKLRPGEFAVLAVSSGLVAFTAGALLGGPLVGMALTIATIVVIRLGLGWKANRRQAAFAEQLPDNLQLLAGSVRAGYGLVQAIDAVSEEALSPSAEEFHRLVVEVNLGRDLNEALTASAARVRSADFEWVVEAMEINRQVGGDLAEVLERVGTTVRDRNQVRRKVQALSAEGRLSAIILIALPFTVAAVISVTNPDYLTELTGSTVGRALIGAGVVLMLVGTAWMRRIVRLVY